MTAAAIASALGNARRSGRGWLCRCLVHDDHDPSLNIADGEDGKLLVKCWAGCDPHDVLAALRQRGLLAGKDIPAHTYHRQAHNTKTDAKGDASRTEAAMRLWRASRPATDTPVATYLRGRGIVLPPPLTLRHNTALKHPGGAYWPGMVALVQRGIDGQPVGIHRTFLARDGKAPVTPDKMMLGLCRGGAVRFAPAGKFLMIGEGIETTLSAMQAAGLPAWAALSTSGLRSLDLPPEVREVIVLADGDNAGEKAAQAAALRWTREGRKVRIARPPRGLDFNDVLLDRTADGAA